MSTMPKLRSAFAAALAGAAQCDHATLTYERVGDGSKRKQQRLSFAVRRPDGSKHTVSEAIPPQTDLIAKATEMGRQYAATLGG